MTSANLAAAFGITQPKTLLIPLPGNADIAIVWPQRLSEAQWAHLMAVLEAMKPGLVLQPQTAQERREASSG